MEWYRFVLCVSVIGTRATRYGPFLLLLIGPVGLVVRECVYGVCLVPFVVYSGHVPVKEFCAHFQVFFESFLLCVFIYVAIFCRDIGVRDVARAFLHWLVV